MLSYTQLRMRCVYIFLFLISTSSIFIQSPLPASDPPLCTGYDNYKLEIQASTDGGYSWSSAGSFVYAQPGETLNILIRTRITVTTGQTQSWSYGILHDPTDIDSSGGAISLNTVTTDGTQMNYVNPDTDNTEIRPNGYTQGVVVSVGGSSVMWPVSDLEISKACYSITMPNYPGAYFEVPFKLSNDVSEIDSIVTQGGVNYPLCASNYSFWFYTDSYTSPSYSSCNLTGNTSVVSAFNLEQVSSACTFIRSDVNNDSTVDISDGIRLLNVLFLLGGGFTCDDAADSNDNGNIDISDSIYIFNFLFLGGSAPPAPYPQPGEDLTMDELSCGTANPFPILLNLDEGGEEGIIIMLEPESPTNPLSQILGLHSTGVGAGVFFFMPGLGGLAAVDYNDDDKIDLFLSNIEGVPDRLLKNVSTPGDIKFEEVDVGVSGVVVDPGTGNSSKPRSRSAIWFDYNGDTFLDLFVLGDCNGCDLVQIASDDPNTTEDETDWEPLGLDAEVMKWSRPRLYKQERNGQSVSFVDVSNLAKLDIIDFLDDYSGTLTMENSRALGGLAAGDLNGDMIPDVVVSHWYESNGQPIANNLVVLESSTNPTTGEIEYTKVKRKPGSSEQLFKPVCGDHPDYVGAGWQPIINDFNCDGKLDILSAHDGDTAKLWENTSTTNLSFIDISEIGGISHHGSNMGVTAGDPNGDGLLDFFISNNSGDGSPLFVRKCSLPGSSCTSHSTCGGTTNPFQRVLLTQEHDPGLPNPPCVGQNCTQCVTPQCDNGVHCIEETFNGNINTDPWGWGTSFVDVDLDGRQDLVMANWNFAGGLIGLGNQIALNTGNPGEVRFQSKSVEWYFDPDTKHSSGLVAADFDRDGYPDVASVSGTNPNIDGQLRIQKNEFSACSSNNWIVIQTRPPGTNSRGIGAKVKVIVNYTDGSQITQSRLIAAGSSFLSQEPAEAHFGLGTKSISNVDVRVEWPGDVPAGTSNRCIFTSSQINGIQRIPSGSCFFSP